MKRQIGTILSVLGLLAVGSAAAAINVRMLHGSASEAASFEMRMAGDVTPLGSASSSASAADSATATASPLASGPGNRFNGSRRHGDDTATVGGRGSVGSLESDGDGDRHNGSGDGDRPQLSEDQLALLRVAAMVRLSPETVRAVAKGDSTDDAAVAAVKQAAAAVGTTLKHLAAVTLPQRSDRGHGGHGFGDHGGSGGSGGTLAPDAGTTYDD